MKKTFILIFSIAFIVCQAQHQKLIFIQELFRHGARYPIYPSSEDGTQYADQLKSQGQLTTQGKNMHYLLGKAIYQKYWSDLFGGTQYQSNYNQSKFYFKATDVNRTIQSCQSHLMGIFQNTKTLQISEDEAKFSSPLWPNTQAVSGQVFKNARDFHPLPIHVQKSFSTSNYAGDFLRAYTQQVCPNQKTWTAQNQHDSFVQQIKSNQNITNTINEFSKFIQKNKTFQDIGQLYDNYVTTKYLGRKYLSIFQDPKYERDLKYIYVLDVYINLFYNRNQIRATSSRFFQHTIKNMKRAVNLRDVQWVIYSAHDTTVANVLTGMNLTSVACIYEAYLKGDQYNEDKCIPIYPGYTANIIFELWQNDLTKEVVFKVRYLGELRKIPFCNYSMECSLQRLEQWWKNEIHEPNFFAACGIHNEDEQLYFGAAVFQFGIIICFILYFLVNYLKKKMVKDDLKKQVFQRTILTQQTDHKQ